MTKPGTILTSLMILLALLGHHVHGTTPVTATVATEAISAVPMVQTHRHAGIDDLTVVHHGDLEDIVPELCTIGDTAAPSASAGHSAAAMLVRPSLGDMILAPVALTPSWQVPAVPPDILRALLQVFLN